VFVPAGRSARRLDGVDDGRERGINLAVLLAQQRMRERRDERLSGIWRVHLEVAGAREALGLQFSAELWQNSELVLLISSRVLLARDADA